jgi:hypothetical protein
MSLESYNVTGCNLREFLYGAGLSRGGARALFFEINELIP